MFDWLRRKIMSRIGGRCPKCGGRRVSVEATSRPPFIVDGPLYANFRCRDCGNKWRIPVRTGI